MKRFAALVACAVAFAAPVIWARGSAGGKPNLVLVLVFDQFRADYLTRFEPRFGPAGFRYLMKEGAYYPFAEYDELQSVTCAGHATILTGSYPYRSGIVGNDWYDGVAHAKIPCSDDPAQALVLPAGAPESAAAKQRSGHSPRWLEGSTVGDELKNAGYHSKVVALGLKDRAAVMLGGHRADLALWFDLPTFGWVSSRYYLREGKLPEWVEKLDAEIAIRKGETVRLEAKGPGTGLSLKDPMMMRDDWNGRAGVTFPHEAKIGTHASLDLPYGLQLTEQAAERAIENLKLGSGRATDVLAITFSSTDYAGHSFGPNSREMEEMTVAADETVSKLLAYVRAKIPGGLSKTLVVVTGDHGVAPNPDWLKREHVDASRISGKAMADAIETRLRAKFGKPKNKAWVAESLFLNFYLDRESVEASRADPALIEAEARDALEKVPGVARAFTAADYRARRLPPGADERQILKSYFPGRSADVIGIPRPFFISEGETTSHVSGYAYDRVVPLIITGPGVRAGKRANRAEVVDLAPTLAWLLGVVPPALSEGRVLSEALSASAP